MGILARDFQSLAFYFLLYGYVEQGLSVFKLPLSLVTLVAYVTLVVFVLAFVMIQGKQQLHLRLGVTIFSIQILDIFV